MAGPARQALARRKRLGLDICETPDEPWHGKWLYTVVWQSAGLHSSDYHRVTSISLRGGPGSRKNCSSSAMGTAAESASAAINT